MQPLPLIVVCAALTSLLPPVCQGVTYRDSLRCPARVLKGGRVRVRNRGRVAKYICLRGYQVLGDKYSTCIRGKWDSPLPVCIYPGCLPVDVVHGQVVETYRGALITVHCDPGYQLTGPQSIYCNGARWNGTAPSCRETTIKSQKWCDFESEDLCGWTHDPNHDFDWRRHNYATPSGHVGTGPSYDHTLGVGLNGHYMYLETSSPRLVNDTARLFSPYFSAPSNPQSCFIFWYHMFGLTTGTLNVYLHKQDTVMLYTLTGDQGDSWHQAIVSLPPITSNFQIVIEGVRGSGFEGDTAIDDVKLAEGDDCIQVSTSPEATSETVNTEDSSSCVGRCFNSPSHPSLCECTSDCIANNTCCPDFLIKCLSSTADTDLIGSTTETQETKSNPLSSVHKVSTLSTETTVRRTTYVQHDITVPHVVSTTTSPSVVHYTVPRVASTTTSPSVVHYTARPVAATTTSPSAVHYTVPRVVSTTTSPSVIHYTVIKNIKANVTASKTIGITRYSSTRTSDNITSTLKPLEKQPTTIPTKRVTIKNQMPIVQNSSTSFKNNPMMSKTTPLTRQRTLVFIKPTTLAQHFIKTLTPTKSPLKQSTNSNKTIMPSSLPPKRSQSKKPKLEFITPPTIVFRQPVKVTLPQVATKIISTLHIINKTTTESYKLSKKVTKEISKSKNDVLHPYWKEQVSGRKTTVVPTRFPINFNGFGTPSITRRITVPVSTTPARSYKWMSNYKRTTEAPPVHAPYAKSLTHNGVVHIIVLMCLVLLCIVLTTVVIMRRRKINRRRLEDDELDIHFLASDEILDFTLSRPDESQVCETLR